MRFIPDPTHQGQQETEADLIASPGETEQWRALLQLLAAETSDPEDCYFGLWEGWGFPESARRWPTFGVPRGAQIPARSYFLFRGPLSEAEIWGTPAEAGIWGPARVLAGRYARVRLAVRPHVVRRGGHRPTLGRGRSDRAVDRAAGR